MPNRGYENSRKQWDRFCLEYMKNGQNGRQAAISAGYAEVSAKVQANKLLQKEYVKNKLNELRAEVKEELMITFKDVLEGFLKEARDDENKGGERIQAWIQVGKHIGFFEKDNAQKNPYKPEPPAPKRDLPDECR